MIQIMVFDKTGTLTEDGLQILGVRGLTGEADNYESGIVPLFSNFVASVLEYIPSAKKKYMSDDNKLRTMNWILQEAMACCHAITYIGEELIGDPLEIKMFESTKWNLYEEGTNTNSMIGGNDLVLATVTPNEKKPGTIHVDQEFSSLEDSYKSDEQN